MVLVVVLLVVVLVGTVAGLGSSRGGWLQTACSFCRAAALGCCQLARIRSDIGPSL
jgi:hypothetical protein